MNKAILSERGDYDIIDAANPHSKSLICFRILDGRPLLAMTHL